MASDDNDERVARAVDAVWRIESARVIAALTRVVRDVGLAEDLAQDALVAALEQWPQSGIPDRPGAWLTATAKHRAIDTLRRRATLERKHELIAHELEEDQRQSGDQPLGSVIKAEEERIGDELLSLIFLTCHPLLSTDARVALTLRLFGGLRTDEVASAFLVPEATIAQRIVRAKRTLAAAGVPFETPAGADLIERLPAVLGVIYLIFNEGYAASSGDEWVREELCAEAQRLGRILAGLLPVQPEVHGLVALMELQASRLRARRGKDGAPVLLADQDRARWDRLLIRRGLEALDASNRAAARLGQPAGPYAIQAGIAAAHARAPSTEQTDWEQIVALYDALAQLTDSPVVALNRAVAVSMAFGPGPALELVDVLIAEPTLSGYHLLPTVRADLLIKLGRHAEAAGELTRALELTRNEREREMLRGRLRALQYSLPAG
ncbi:MAG: RNA polymerase sigma factor [Solirubrobacteraceae bacterium]